MCVFYNVARHRLATIYRRIFLRKGRYLETKWPIFTKSCKFVKSKSNRPCWIRTCNPTTYLYHYATQPLKLFWKPLIDVVLYLQNCHFRRIYSSKLSKLNTFRLNLGNSSFKSICKKWFDINDISYMLRRVRTNGIRSEKICSLRQRTLLEWFDQICIGPLFQFKFWKSTSISRDICIWDFLQL